MLKGTFFHILQITESKEEAEADNLPGIFRIAISLDPTHPIYQGHFPGNPVVPGVCQLRIITEIISEITQKEVRLLEADNIKFLSMINPFEHPELAVDCTLQKTEEGYIRVTASISDREKVFYKSKSLVA
ncbi:MAG: 3-hydroxyacyl-ACP dehydratase [Bacteroidota bacterium]